MSQDGSIVYLDDTRKRSPPLPLAREEKRLLQKGHLQSKPNFFFRMSAKLDNNNDRWKKGKDK